MNCDGSCDVHVGEVKQYEIAGWSGVWNYCDSAFEEDKRRGLKIWLVDEKRNEA